MSSELLVKLAGKKDKKRETSGWRNAGASLGLGVLGGGLGSLLDAGANGINPNAALLRRLATLGTIVGGYHAGRTTGSGKSVRDNLLSALAGGVLGAAVPRSGGLKSRLGLGLAGALGGLSDYQLGAAIGKGMRHRSQRKG